MYRRRAGRRRGVTLLELLLVLAIVAVFAAMAAPRYGRASARYRLDLAARRVATDLRLAQTHAKAASSSRTVMFSAGTEQYQLLNVPALDGAVGSYTVFLSAEPYRVDLVWADFGGAAQITFNGWGLPGAGGTVVISAGGQQKSIMVAGDTGQVSIP
jgi:prepilin-type N-terminal cleavage/methylation domain-containing protein